MSTICDQICNLHFNVKFMGLIPNEWTDYICIYLKGLTIEEQEQFVTD